MSYYIYGAGASPYLPDLTGTFVDDGFLKLVQLLGSSRSARVYKAFDTTSPEADPINYAVKCMQNDAPGSKRVAALRNEFDLHKYVTGQSGVVKSHGIFSGGKEGEYVFMVLDAGCSMQDAIVKRQLYVDRPALIRDAFFQLLDAVEECHKNGVYHRDLQPTNLLCDSKGSWIRIADFGAATHDEESTEFQRGSPAYMSPECADSTRASYSPRESDLWAVAVILFSFITGTTHGQSQSRPTPNTPPTAPTRTTISSMSSNSRTPRTTSSAGASLPSPRTARTLTRCTTPYATSGASASHMPVPSTRPETRPVTSLPRVRTPPPTSVSSTVATSPSPCASVLRPSAAHLLISD
ncbi:kinase-like domain-containing protein [Mycena capillaripes]|nr:kinase-like domain-containing protein [Mycena capillaripes]